MKPSIVPGNAADVMFQPIYTTQCPLPNPAGIRVVNEGWLKDGHEVAIQQVVHNTVAKGSGKHFPLYRPIDNEAHAAAHLICAGEDFLI